MSTKNILSSVLTLFLLVTIFSCSSKPDPAESIKFMNGFWEINEAILPDGTVTAYGSNITVDFIEVDGQEAIRKKVVPVPGGGFTATTSEESFIIAVEEDSLRLYHSTPFDSWKETVIKLDANEFRVRGKNNRIFIYTRYEL